MRGKTAKKPRKKTETFGETAQAANCSSSLEIAPNIQENTKTIKKQQAGRIPVEKPEIEGSVFGESTRLQEIATKIHGESSQTSNSSVSQPKSPQLQRFASKQKPQISTIPGTSPKERNRYRVVFGTDILGDFLTLDEALELAAGGEG